MADIDFGVFDTNLADVPTVATALAAAPRELPYDPTVFVRRAVPAMYANCEVGSEGLEHEIVLDTAAIVAKGGCGFLREAIGTGGEHHSEPLWQFAILASTFLPNGRAVAHGMSDRHPKYTPAETDEKFDYKESVKKSRTGGMGWPSCAAIQAAGCTNCATCPHAGQIRSPLNLGLKKHAPAPTEQPPETSGLVTFAGNQIYPGYSKFDLPDGYVFNAKGHVCVVITETEKTADGIEKFEKAVPILNNQYILAPHAQQAPDAIIFTIDGSMGELRPVMLERGKGSSSHQSTLERLGDQGVAPNFAVGKRVGEFLMDLLRKIELLKKSSKAQPFGWAPDTDGGGYNKFIYGKTFHRDGTVTEGGYLDERMRHLYGPCGKIEPWLKAAKFVTDQNRADYQIFLATTFGACLMQYTNQPLVVVSMIGLTGTGKSTVLKIAAAAWGHPLESRLTYEPTLNAAGHKMGVLANLPVYFDEVTEEPAMLNCLKVASMEGNERERLQSKAGILAPRKSGHWSTWLCTTGNRSLLDFVSRQQRDTAMGRARIFEIVAEDRRKDRNWDTDPMMLDLNFNFGQAGLVYAKFLAENSAELGAMIAERGRAFDKLVKAQQSERFWSILCGCILLSAEFANKLGLVDFDIPAMQDYLVKAFLAQREKLVADGQEGAGVGIELLTAFMKEHAQHMMVTDGLPARGGKKDKTPFNIIRQPQLSMGKGIYFQWVDRKVNPILRVSRDRLIAWLKKNERQPSVVFDRIPHRITDMVVLGGKTQHALGPERCMEMDIISGSWLRDVLNDIVGRYEEPTPTDEQSIMDSAAIAKEKDDEHGTK